MRAGGLPGRTSATRSCLASSVGVNRGSLLLVLEQGLPYKFNEFRRLNLLDDEPKLTRTELAYSDRATWTELVSSVEKCPAFRICAWLRTTFLCRKGLYRNSLLVFREQSGTPPGTNKLNRWTATISGGVCQGQFNA